MHKTEDLDCQVCHEESLKTVKTSTKNEKTGHGLQRDRDLPLRADGAWNNTSSMSDADFSIFEPSFIKIPLEETDVDEDALYREMKGKTLEGLSLLNPSFTCKTIEFCSMKKSV